MSEEIHKRGDEQVKIVHDLVPKEWDIGPLSLAHEIRNLLKPVVDEGRGIDSGGGDGIADLFPIIGGVEYHIQIKTARKLPPRHQE